MESLPNNQKKKILMDIIANIEEEASFEEIREMFKNGAEMSVPLDLVREAAKQLEKEGIISIESGKITPKISPKK